MRAELADKTSDFFRFNARGHGLSNKDGFFGKSDPFLIFYRSTEYGDADIGHWIRVWQSGRINDSLDPRWPESRISMSALCNNDIHRPVKIELWDHEEGGRHQFIGAVTTSVAEMFQISAPAAAPTMGAGGGSGGGAV